LELSSQSQLNFRRVIVTLFEFARERRYLPRAFDEHTQIEVGGSPDGEVIIFTAPEVARLLASAPSAFVPCIALSAFAGLRSAEVERIAWPEIRLPDGIIELRSSKAKTRARRIIPISENLAAWLACHAKESGPVWKGHHDEYYDAQQVTAKAAGIAWKINGLRHAYISHRLALVKDAAKVSLEAGNPPAMVFKHYRELVHERDAVAFFKIFPTHPSRTAMVNGHL
jgi:integrase